MSNWINFGVGAGGFATIAGVTLPLVSRHFGRVVHEICTAIVTAALKELKSDLDKRFDTNDADSKKAADKATSLELKLATEFGGNGGGIRQALNSVQKDVAILSGAFNQHTVEHGK